jgi:hypothetical protein
MHTRHAGMVFARRGQSHRCAAMQRDGEGQRGATIKALEGIKFPNQVCTKNKRNLNLSLSSCSKFVGVMSAEDDAAALALQVESLKEASKHLADELQKKDEALAAFKAKTKAYVESKNKQHAEALQAEQVGVCMFRAVRCVPCGP